MSRVQSPVSPDPGSIETFVAIVGLPRSGTTLLTALLDAHPAVRLYYEPWNASPKSRPPVPEDLSEFRGWMETRFRTPLADEITVTGFKETTVNADSTAWAVATLEQIAEALEVEVIWIHRDPIHSFLSKLEGARKWWGWPDAYLSEDRLAEFLQDGEAQIAALDGLLRRRGGSIVQYEALVESPAEVLEELMIQLGVKFDPVQLDYFRGGMDRHRVNGDPGLIANPAPVHRDSMARRAGEFMQHADLIRGVLGRPRFSAIRARFAELASLPAVAPIAAIRG
jgi:hypothetical protein